MSLKSTLEFALGKLTLIPMFVMVQSHEAPRKCISFCLVVKKSAQFFREMNSLFSSTFSNQLLMSLLRLLQASDADVRLLVLNTFQILVRLL